MIQTWVKICVICALCVTCGLEIIGCVRGLRSLPEPPRRPAIDVVYPRVERPDTLVSLPRVDSTFTFGSLKPPQSRLWVNGLPVKVWPNGAFLAYVPLDTVADRFSFLAISPRGDTVRTALPFRLPPPAQATGIPPAHPMNLQLPARITITRDYAAARSAPNQAYTLFPPKGSVALADSFAAGYYRVYLGKDRHAWIEEKFTTLDTARRDIPAASASKIAVQAGNPWATVEIPLAEPVFFQLEPAPQGSILILDLYGVTSRLNRMDYDPSDSLVREIRWSQADDDRLQLQIFLNSARIWGYQASWEADSTAGRYRLLLKIRRPPRLEERPLQGRVIVLDPGHGGSQPGSTGPTRLSEKEPNLKLALRLKQRLEDRGARVLLTRSADSTVDLYDRINFAVKQGGEVLVSLHNNALSDGENPFIKHGSGAYYYQPLSLPLARTLHHYLLKGTRLRDNGLYYQNLALARVTEMPAVLLETAFVMYPDEEQLLRDDRFLDRIAKSLCQGLEEYFKDCQKEQTSSYIPEPS